MFGLLRVLYLASFASRRMHRRSRAMALGALFAAVSAMHVGVQRVGELTPRHTSYFSATTSGREQLHVQRLTPARAPSEEEGFVSMAWTPHPIHVLKGEPTVSETGIARVHAFGSSTDKCLSHELFQVLSQGMVVAGNIKETAESVNSPSYKGDQMSKVLTLSIGLVLSILLLIFGAKLATTAIAIVLFVVSFFLTFGFLDSMLYKPGVPPNFNMCVMPWVAAVIIAMLCAILVLCCAAKLAELSLFVLGFALGAVGMYLARSAIVASVPELMKETHGFSYYWAILVIVALLCGLLATWIKKGIFMAATIIIGAYGVATCVAGLVMTATNGKPMGYEPGDIGTAHFGPFMAVFITSAIIGLALQLYFMKQDEAKKKEEEEKKKDEEKQEKQ